VYAGDYLELGHEYFSMSDEELLERFIPAFQKNQPRIQDCDWVKKMWVNKTNYAQPVPLVGSFKKYSRHSNAHRRLVLRFDESGLPVGSRHELRGGDRQTRGEDDERSIIHSIADLPLTTYSYASAGILESRNLAIVDECYLSALWQGSAFFPRCIELAIIAVDLHAFISRDFLIIDMQFRQLDAQTLLNFQKSFTSSTNGRRGRVFFRSFAKVVRYSGCAKCHTHNRKYLPL
jgi:hypothetical protein